MLLTQGEGGQEGPSFVGYLEGAFSGRIAPLCSWELWVFIRTLCLLTGHLNFLELTVPMFHMRRANLF